MNALNAVKTFVSLCRQIPKDEYKHCDSYPLISSNNGLIAEMGMNVNGDLENLFSDSWDGETARSTFIRPQYSKINADLKKHTPVLYKSLTIFKSEMKNYAK